jgi:hypothetical protein
VYITRTKKGKKIYFFFKYFGTDAGVFEELEKQFFFLIDLYVACAI